MTKVDVLAKLQTVFDNVFVDPVTVTEGLTANDVPEWDSLIHISLIIAIEKAMGFRFSMGDVESTRNVGELTDIIMKRVNV